VSPNGQCEGCGVDLQMANPDAPGYFRVPEKLLVEIWARRDGGPSGAAGGGRGEAGAFGEGDGGEEDDGLSLEDLEAGALDAPGGLNDGWDAGADDDGPGPGDGPGDSPGELDGEGIVRMVIDDPELDRKLGVKQRGRVTDDDIFRMMDEEATLLEEMGAGGLEGNYGGEGVGVGDAYGELAGAWLAGGGGRRKGGSADGDMEGRPRVMCARCFSLINYGRVKSAEAEAALPGFDIRRRVGRKLEALRGRKGVLAVVVDVSDFDGSLPRWALAQILPRNAEGAPVTVPGISLVVVANKVDLLPRQVSKHRLEQWIRRRARQGGLPRPDAVVLTSALSGFGIARAKEEIEALAGERGQVFVVGAQNAGKSSVLNAVSQAGGAGTLKLTTAALPGTTLGVVEVKGLLSGKARVFDTPGVPHGYQLSSRLTKEELDLAMPRKQLRPRTYRLGPGKSVSVGGLARLDVTESDGATIYLTVWASQMMVLHMGATDKSAELWSKHLGANLRPPASADRVAELGGMVPTDVTVEGDDWTRSGTDIHIAGLGWAAVGCKGKATVRVWAPKGVALTTRESLVPDYADQFERPGFSENSKVLKYDGGAAAREGQGKGKRGGKGAARGQGPTVGAKRGGGGRGRGARGG